MKNIMFILLFTVVFFSDVFPKGTLETSGYILKDSIWSADTVNINGDIIIDDGITLTIKPGTHVQFKGHFKIDVQGTLIAKGTKKNKITFSAIDTTLTPNSGGWQGIRFNNTSSRNDSSIISFCLLMYGNAFGYFPSSSGGAIYVNKFNRLTISNSTFKNNFAYQGGAIYCFGASPIIRNNIITNNFADEGGGIYYHSFVSINILNNLITKNQAFTLGGGIFCRSHSTKIINNTIVNNKASKGGGIFFSKSSPKIINSIIWGNLSNDKYEYNCSEASNPVFSYCNIENGIRKDSLSVDKSGNIDSNPNFVSSTNFALAPSSPCIDRGTSKVFNKRVVINQDIDNNTRIYKNETPIIDIGAYEFQGDACLFTPLSQNNNSKLVKK